MSRLLKIEIDNFTSFRWVECQFKSLQLCLESEYHLDCLLNSLPQSLDETYERILCNIEQNLIEDCRRILTLLCFSARPLTVPELIDAMAVEISSERLNLKRRLRNADGIRDICVGLVDVNLSSDDAAASNGQEKNAQTVRIAHFSVQEYLESERIRNQKAAIFSLIAVEAHADIAQICLIYLLEPGLIATELDKYPLRRYAARFWYRHYKSTEYLDTKLENLILQLFKYQRFIFWIMDSLEFVNEAESHYFTWDFDSNESPVDCASLLGLRWVLKELISVEQEKNSKGCILSTTSTIKSADFNSQNGHYGSALRAASYLGHKEILKLLIEKGADVNAQGGRFNNALQEASSQGHGEVVNLLVEEGADVNAQGGFYGNALQAASTEGHEKIVKLLVERGADVNAQGGFYGNALQAASREGHEKIVKLLGKEGADVNAQGGEYGNALQAASREGHEKIVKLLFEEGADVNAQGGTYGNALQLASRGGHEMIVKLLVEGGADVNVQGGFYGNALQAASRGGHEKIVNLLVKEGADVNAQGGEYGNALQATSFGGHEKIVKLLVKEGADVNAQGGEYCNALQAASSGGHEKIVKLLVEEGAVARDPSVNPIFGAGGILHGRGPYPWLRSLVNPSQGSQRLKRIGFGVKLNQIEIIKGQTVETEVLRKPNQQLSI